MNRCITIIASQLLANAPSPTKASPEEIEGHLAFLFWYLDQELEILSTNLYENVFQRILRQIYITLLHVSIPINPLCKLTSLLRILRTLFSLRAPWKPANKKTKHYFWNLY